ncbi:hypothetical protein LTR95_000944 [Oleoguttula sp. CCFEE 5521]
MAPKKTPRLSQFSRRRHDDTKFNAYWEANKTAAMEVFNLPELLEVILPNLDMKTLLLAQGVNTKFKTTIENSEECQDKLFFRLKEERGKDGVDMLNPMLVKSRIASGCGSYLGRCKCDACVNEKWTFTFDVSKLPQHASARRMALSWRVQDFCPPSRTPLEYVLRASGGTRIGGWRLPDTEQVGEENWFCPEDYADCDPYYESA